MIKKLLQAAILVVGGLALGGCPFQQQARTSAPANKPPAADYQAPVAAAPPAGSVRGICYNDADLVTYSACNSVGSQETPTDELVGLGWLTLAAGARAVVASLWRVPELSTALLMRRFYRELAVGRPPRKAPPHIRCRGA